jgi:hypothetical protein
MRMAFCATEGLRRGAGLDVRLIRDRDVLRALHVAAGHAPARPHGERRHARVLFLTVDVDVVGHVRSARRAPYRAREVFVHHRRAERVRDHVDLRAPRPLLERGDRFVDLLFDLALVCHRER